MPIFKTTLFFRDTAFTKDAGWSETYYCTSSDTQGGFVSLQNFALDRLRLCPENIIIDAGRVSSNLPEQHLPGSRLAAKGTIKQFGFAGARPATNTDVPWTCLFASFTDITGNVKRNSLWRGIDDNFWDLNTDKLARAAANGILPRILRSFQQNGFLLRHQTARRVVGPPFIPPVFSYLAAQRLDFQAISKRNTGRPFGALRGRRSR